MTRNDVVKLLAVIRLAWPHSNIDRGDTAGTVGLWHSFLKDVDQLDGERAVRELIAGGREHAPTLSVVLGTLGQRETDSPEFDEAWPEVQRLIRRYGRNQKPGPEPFSHPTIAAYALPSWEELCNGPAQGTPDYGTHYAQQRNAYNAMRARATRDVSLDIVGAPRRRGELKLLDPLKSLGLEKP